MRDWIEKQRNLIDFTLSSLLRRKGKNLALTLVYTAVVFSLGSALFFSHAMKREASILLAGAPEVIVQKLVAGRHDLIPLRYAEKISGIRGVQSVRGRLWGYYFDPVVGANYTFMASDRLHLEPESAAIGNGISRDRGVFQGDMLSFRGQDGEPMSFLIKEILSRNRNSHLRTSSW